MFVRNLNDCEVITALDGTTLRELLNPLHDGAAVTIGYSIAHAIVKPGQTSLPHRIKTASEVYYILKGKGRMHIDEDVCEVGPGDLVYIPPNSTQYLENTGEGDVLLLCVVDPYWRPEFEELVK